MHEADKAPIGTRKLSGRNVSEEPIGFGNPKLFEFCFTLQDTGLRSCEPWEAKPLPKCSDTAGHDRGSVVQSGQQHLGDQLCDVAAVRGAEPQHGLQV
jgi:hypothetical protein